jgi:hypothetical protein
LPVAWNLRPHLRRDSSRARSFRDGARLEDIAAQRLLRVDVLLSPKRRERGKGVRMLGRAHHHRVELRIFQLIVQPPKIPELLRARCLHRRRIQFFAFTSQSATMFSPSISAMFDPPRPPQPMMTMFSLLPGD